MKTPSQLRLILSALLLTLLLSNFSVAQTYNAGVGSGTGGTNNVFVGSQAGRITTCSYNSFIGFSSGFSNTTGTANSFLGSYSGYSNTTGNQNSFVSYDAGSSNTTGNYNSFLGYRAGYLNTTGAYNSFLGHGAGYSNTTASFNTIIGYQAGYNTNNGNNTFFGYQAGYANTTGYENLFFGSKAGANNINGYANAFVGYQAGTNNSSGYSNTLFGWQAGYSNTTAARNSFFGNFAGQNTTTGSENVFLGRSAGANNINGYFNVSLGNFAGPSVGNLINATAIGYRASVSASNSLVLGSIIGVNGATDSTKVGIKTTDPKYDLHVNGSAAKPGGGPWINSSDQRLKKDITDFTDGLAQVQQIRPVWYRYNGKAGMPTQKKYVGVIAQEMQKVAPYTIGEFTYTDTTGKQEKYLDYDANAVTYMLVNAVKEVDEKYARQQQELAEKEAKLTSQQQQINALQGELAQIKALLLKQPTAANVEGGAARLWQNKPNPTDGTTVIRYFIPQEATSAQLKIFSMSGQEVQSLELNQRGQGQVELSNTTFAVGTYVYHLIVNGKQIDSKKLVLTR